MTVLYSYRFDCGVLNYVVKEGAMGKGFCSPLAKVILFFVCAVVPTQSAASIPAAAGDGMLQFRASGHIIGFAPGKAYLAALDHALSVEFLGGRGVMPKGNGDLQAKDSSSGAQSLGKVFYENLWDGISLTYEATKDGITESTYHLAPCADVAKIRLKYNSPVEMQKDGSLEFRFDEGRLTESAPIAWQEIEGRRIPVEVAFRVSGDEVGFSVGKYDHDRPLVIDPTYSWHTFYGAGGGTTYGTGIAVDSNGNVYVTGYSSSSWGSPLSFKRQ
jgi:hypothetical protein